MPTYVVPSPPMAKTPMRTPGASWQAAPAPTKAQPPVLAAQASGTTPQQPQPRVRLQAPEEPRPAPPAPFTLPSPEELGIASPHRPAEKSPPPDMDLNTAFARLRELKAQSFSLDRQAQGGFRARFQLPNQQWIEGEGTSETTAIAAALARVESR